MRVITPYGLGDAADFDQPVIDVVMGQGSPEPALRLVRYAEAFPLTDFATVRVINLLGRPHSNLQFHSTRKFTQRLLTMPSPPDETTLAVDLAAGTFTLNRTLPTVWPALLIRPWLDRWGEDRGQPFGDTAAAMAAFDAERTECAGACGIACSLVLELPTRRVLGFAAYAYPPVGIMVHRRFSP